MIIRNGRIITMAGIDFPKGDIRIQDGKIVEISETINTSDLNEIDATGLIVMPGLVDAHTHIGGMNFAKGLNIDDLNEMTNPLTANVQSIYSIDSDSKDFQTCLENGITTVCVTPGSGNIVNGWVSAVKTSGFGIKKKLIKNPVALKIALGGNPKGTYEPRKQSPATRMSIPTMLNQLFDEAKEYNEALRLFEKGKGEKPKYNSNYEAILPVIRKEIPLKIHCTQFDMITAIEFATNRQLDFTLEHAWGASDYIDEIVQSGCGICYGPLGSLRKPGESIKIDIESVVELDKRGVLVAIITDSPIVAQDSILEHAGEVVRAGLSIERVLPMITINAARILGIEEKVGSLEIGKNGDIAIFKGIPALDTDAKVYYTIQDGELVYKRTSLARFT